MCLKKGFEKWILKELPGLTFLTLFDIAECYSRKLHIDCLQNMQNTNFLVKKSRERKFCKVYII